MQHDGPTGDSFDLGNLPDTALEITLSYLKFDNIARLRRVNKRFDLNCKSMLNKGFISVERYHAKCLKVCVLDIWIIKIKNSYFILIFLVSELKLWWITKSQLFYCFLFPYFFLKRWHFVVHYKYTNLKWRKNSQ